MAGYPIKWFVKAPPCFFKCVLCENILNNPQQCKNGDSFCLECITPFLENHQECPTCKIALSSDKLYRNLPTRNLIDKLPVKCNHDLVANNNNCCEWTGNLKDSIEHFETCQKRPLPCLRYANNVCCDKNCTGYMQRMMAQHLVSKRGQADSACITAKLAFIQKQELFFLRIAMENRDARLHIDNDGEFFGVLKDGKRHGFGYFVQSDGSSYSGYFKDGLYCGFGVARSDKVMSAGEWEDGKLNGHGVSRWPSIAGETMHTATLFNTYIGDYENDKKYGLGWETSCDCTFVGVFKNGAKHGEGACFFDNGDFLKGTYDTDAWDHYCSATLTTRDGSMYAGTLSNDRHFIQGVYTDANGVVFEGVFSDDAHELNVSGTGTIKYTDGSIYTGEFRNGLKHISCTSVDTDGTSH